MKCEVNTNKNLLAVEEKPVQLISNVFSKWTIRIICRAQFAECGAVGGRITSATLTLAVRRPNVVASIVGMRTKPSRSRQIIIVSTKRWMGTLASGADGARRRVITRPH